MNPYSLTGLTPGQAPARGTTPIPGIERSAVVAPADNAQPWHPDNPIFWFGAIAAATIGLIAANASIRVGPFRASAGAGKSGKS